jgi:hypothetical protein
MSHPDPAIRRSPWLSQALHRIRMMPRAYPLRDGVEGLAIQLLRSIEADDLPVPSIWSHRRAAIGGTINISWTHHGRLVWITVVGPEEFRCVLVRDGRTVASRSVRWHRPEAMRRLIKWIFPAANAVSVRKGV